MSDQFTESNTTLETLKTRVESLWTKLSHAKTESEKASLRSQYEEAFRKYQTQQAIIESPSTCRSNPKNIPRHQRHNEQPNPFQFHDYRDFILAWLRYFKAKEGGTLAAFSKDTGLSPEYIVKALRRLRRLDMESHTKIIQRIPLTPSEAEFIEALYHASETESRDIRLAALKKLLSFTEFRKANPSEYEAWRYLSHWYYVAIREMATLPGFRAEPKWIQEKLQIAVPEEEIAKALDFLDQSGFFPILPDGTVESRLKYVRCSGGIFRLALGKFHREILELGAHAIDRVPSDQRMFLGHSTTLRAEHFESVCQILFEAMEKIKSLGSSDTPGTPVFHIELGLFPMTKLERKKK